MRVVLLGAFLWFVSVVSAGAAPILVSFSTTGLGPLTFQADTFSMAGASGSLALDTAATTTNAVNLATFTAGNSGTFSGSQSLTLSYSLTLAGVTHLLSQSATWSISPSLDTFIAVAASAPVLFDTASGDWAVRLNAFSFTASFIGETSQQPVTADFTPVPEPTSLLLIGSGVGWLARRRLRASRS